MTSVEIKRPLPHCRKEIEILTQQLENFNFEFNYDKQKTNGKTLGKANELYKEKKVNINCTKSKHTTGKTESDAGVEIVDPSKIKDDSNTDKEIMVGSTQQAESVVTILNVKQVEMKNKNDNKEKLKDSAQHAKDVAVKVDKNTSAVSEEVKKFDDSQKVLTPNRIEENKSKVDEEDLEKDSDTEQCDVIPRGKASEKTKKVKPYDKILSQQQICQSSSGVWNDEFYNHKYIGVGGMVGGSVQVNPHPIFQPQVVQTKPVQYFQNNFLYAPFGNTCPGNIQQYYSQSIPYQPQVQTRDTTYHQQPSPVHLSAGTITPQSNLSPGIQSSCNFMPSFHNPQTPPQELMPSSKPCTPDFFEEDQWVEKISDLIPSYTSLEAEHILEDLLEDKISFSDIVENNYSVSEEDKESLGVASPSSGYISHKGDEDSSDAFLQAVECVRTCDPVISNQCMHHHRVVNYTSSLEVYMAYVSHVGLLSPSVEQDNVVAHRNCALLTKAQLETLDEDHNSLLIEVVIKCTDKFLKPLLDRYARSEILNEFINKPNKQRRAPLHYVVHSNDPKKVRLLVDRGADVNAQDVSRIYNNAGSAQLKKQSLIGYVASQGERCLAVLAELLCSPNADLSSCDSEGCTPLHTAILSHNLNGIDSRKTIFHLVLRGANINAQNSLNSKTPLQCAVEKGDIVLVSHLFDVVGRVYPNDREAKIRSMVQPGFSLLKTAYDLDFQDKTHKFYLIELLLKQGAELTQKSFDAALRKEFMQIPGIAEVMKSLAADKRRMQK